MGGAPYCQVHVSVERKTTKCEGLKDITKFAAFECTVLS